MRWDDKLALRGFYKNFRREMRWRLGGRGESAVFWIAECIMFIPDLLHLFVMLFLDRDVFIRDKAKLAVLIAYYLTPIDLFSEILLGPAGYVDDLALGVFVLNSVINNTSPEVVARHWAGSGETLKSMMKVLRAMGKISGTGLWKRISRICRR